MYQISNYSTHLAQGEKQFSTLEVSGRTDRIFIILVFDLKMGAKRMFKFDNLFQLKMGILTMG